MVQIAFVQQTNVLAVQGSNFYLGSFLKVKKMFERILLHAFSEPLGIDFEGLENLLLGKGIFA